MLIQRALFSWGPLFPLPLILFLPPLPWSSPNPGRDLMETFYLGLSVLRSFIFCIMGLGYSCLVVMENVKDDTLTKSHPSWQQVVHVCTVRMLSRFGWICSILCLFNSVCGFVKSPSFLYFFHQGRVLLHSLLIMKPRLASNFRSPCLSLLSAGDFRTVPLHQIPLTLQKYHLMSGQSAISLMSIEFISICFLIIWICYFEEERLLWLNFQVISTKLFTRHKIDSSDWGQL